MLGQEKGEFEDMNMEQLWNHFKMIELTAAKEVCGTKVVSKNKKQ